MISKLKQFEALSDESIALYKKRAEREKKKKEVACDMLESLLDWMASEGSIKRDCLAQHRTALRSLRT